VVLHIVAAPTAEELEADLDTTAAEGGEAAAEGEAEGASDEGGEPAEASGETEGGSDAE
jgi:hypothetical protein